MLDAASRPNAARPNAARLVCARDVLDGGEIFLARNGGWTRRPKEAAIARSEAEARALLAAAETQPDVAMAPRLTAAPG